MLQANYEAYYERFLALSEAYIERTCRLTGSRERAERGELDPHFINDYRYFALTKNTKLLRSVLTLLRIGHDEDAIVLARTMFECYIASRYVDDQFDLSVIRDMILIPSEIAERNAIAMGDHIYRRNSKEEVEYQERNPALMDLGRDRKYFYDLYFLFCIFAHSNYSQVSSYLDDNRHFVLYTGKNAEIAAVIPLFLFYKCFESTVMLEQAASDDESEEAALCAFMVDATNFLYRELSELSASWTSEYGEHADKHMRRLFINMRNTLKEQLGRVDKSFLSDSNTK